MYFSIAYTTISIIVISETLDRRSENMKSILITGCSTGFGRVTALHFAKLGWKVFATVRKEADRESLLNEKAGDIVPLLCDIVCEDQVQELGREVAAQCDRLDVLVNNAGAIYRSPLELLPPAELRAQFEVNVVAQLAVAQAVMPLLKVAKGTIINVSSVAGRITTPLIGAYSASKFALEALSDALRVELAPFGVRVVLIEPGPSPTAIGTTSKRRWADIVAGQSIEVGGYARLIEAADKISAGWSRIGFPPQQFAKLVETILNTATPRARYPIPPRFAWAIAVRQIAPDWLWDWGVRQRLGW